MKYSARKLLCVHLQPPKLPMLGRSRIHRYGFKSFCSASYHVTYFALINCDIHGPCATLQFSDYTSRHVTRSSASHTNGNIPKANFVRIRTENRPTNYTQWLIRDNSCEFFWRNIFGDDVDATIHSRVFFINL